MISFEVDIGAAWKHLATLLGSPVCDVLANTFLSSTCTLFITRQDILAEMPASFDVEIVYGTNKTLGVIESEPIQDVKLGALKLFSIPASEANQFVLKAEIKGQEEQLNEANTVDFYKLHPQQKIKLASGTPYGKQVSRGRIKDKSP